MVKLQGNEEITFELGKYIVIVNESGVTVRENDGTNFGRIIIDASCIENHDHFRYNVHGTNKQINLK